MTDKQRERIKDKIKKIKATLLAEKRKFGGFDDSRGLRYLPPELYLKIKDFNGGLRYLKWFNKHFPDDVGFPEFLFASTVILFNVRKLEEAEDYALKTYFSETFLFDVFFGKELKVLNKNVSDQQVEYLKDFAYRHDQEDFVEFSNWLSKFLQSERFVKAKNEYDDITQQLETEPVGPRRTMLVERLYSLK